MKDLSITVVQTPIHWQNPKANKTDIEAFLKEKITTTDLILLPEMFTTGFSMASEELSETMDGETVKWMVKVASEINAVIAGSLIIKDGGKYYNRLVWAQPNGEVKHYDKRHLFRMASEHYHFSSGSKPCILELKGWKINLQVCYDLRFPVFSRNTKENRYDLLVYVANWPEARRSPWSKLLLARAIENQCYVAGVNRVGKDGTGITYSGDSVVIDPKGEVISSIQPYETKVETVSLSLDELNDFREKFPVGLDADDFSLR